MSFTQKAQIARGRPSSRDKHLDRLLQLKVFHQKEAVRAGVSAPTLSRLVKEGWILRLDQDIYRHPEADIDADTEDFIVACMKFGPQSVIGGATALFHYQIIDQAPSQIWVLVPPNKLSRSKLYRCLRTKTDLSIGVIDHGRYRITTIERSIIEAFKYATKIGLEKAIKAAKSAMSQQLTTPAKIARQARALGLESTISKYWEILISL
jgi:predicted transcriptional regulator of viral defense system